MTALLLAAGCTSDGGKDIRHDDPLLGSGPRSSAPAVANIPAGYSSNGPPPPAYQPQPPLVAATPTSNAALAGGFQPLQGGNDLRIGSGSPTLGTPTSNTQLQQPGFNDPKAPPHSGFSPVTPVPPPGAPAAPAPQSTPVVGPGGTLEQAYAAVAARNPIWTRLTFNSQANEYLFQVNVPSKLNTAVPQTVEASAATPTEAIRRALEQMGN